MIVINTSFHVHIGLVDKFQAWIRQTYIPEALSSAIVSSPRFMSLLIDVQEDCDSYAVSFEAKTIDDAIKWQESKGAELMKTMHNKFGDGVLSFSTCMEDISLD